MYIFISLCYIIYEQFSKLYTQKDHFYIILAHIRRNYYEYQGFAICGTRGWFFEEERSGEHDEKVFKRELMRLEASLKAAGDLTKIVFLHYPPKYKGYECREIIDVLKRYDVRQCYYGHLHGASHGLSMEGVWDGIEYKLLSADRLNFRPFCVLP